MRAAQTALRRPMLPRRQAAERPRKESGEKTFDVAWMLGMLFLAGYLPGVWLGRGSTSAQGQQLAAYYDKSAVEAAIGHLLGVLRGLGSSCKRRGGAGAVQGRNGGFGRGNTLFVPVAGGMVGTLGTGVVPYCAGTRHAGNTRNRAAADSAFCRSAGDSGGADGDRNVFTSRHPPAWALTAFLRYNSAPPAGKPRRPAAAAHG